MLDSKLNQLIFHEVYLFISLLGLLDCFNLLFDNQINLDALVYYTTLSNLGCFIIIFIVFIYNYKDIKNHTFSNKNEHLLVLKYYFSLIIMVTFIVYNFILVDNIFSPGWYRIGNLSKHILSPLLFIIDFFLFDKRKTIKAKHIFLSPLLPLLYALIIIIRGLVLPIDFHGTIYPYFFLNYKEIGIQGLFIYLSVMYFFYLLGGFIFYLLDKIEFKKIFLKLKSKNIKTY